MKVESVIDLTASQSPLGEQLQATITVAIAARAVLYARDGRFVAHHARCPDRYLVKCRLTTCTMKRIPARSTFTHFLLENCSIRMSQISEIRDFTSYVLARTNYRHSYSGM